MGIGSIYIPQNKGIIVYTKNAGNVTELSRKYIHILSFKCNLRLKHTVFNIKPIRARAKIRTKTLLLLSNKLATGKSNFIKKKAVRRMNNKYI